MNWLVMFIAGMCTISVGADMLKSPSPVMAQYVVFGVAAGFTIAALVIEAIRGGEDL